MKDSYVYLGTITPKDGMSWTAHLKSAIGKARRRSADLLWVCRADRGMRPRTAITLWQSMVRPLLEYASELWVGQVPTELTRGRVGAMHIPPWHVGAPRQWQWRC